MSFMALRTIWLNKILLQDIEKLFINIVIHRQDFFTKEIISVTGKITDNSPCVFYKKCSRSNIPGTKAIFVKPVVTATGDIGQVSSGRTQPADTVAVYTPCPSVCTVPDKPSRATPARPDAL